jgi:hypothetical protein
MTTAEKDVGLRPQLDHAPPEFEAAMQVKRENMTDTEIRQGKTGVGVRYVLAVSLALTLIALLGIYFAFLNTAPA